MSERVIRSGSQYAGQQTWPRTVLSNVLSVLAIVYAACMKEIYPFVMNGEEKTINMQMYFHSLQIDLYTSSVEKWRN